MMAVYDGAFNVCLYACGGSCAATNDSVSPLPFFDSLSVFKLQDESYYPLSIVACG